MTLVVAGMNRPRRGKSMSFKGIAMSTRTHTLAMLILVVGGFCSSSGCQSDGPTTRIDYTYDKPIWTDASFEKPAVPQK